MAVLAVHYNLYFVGIFCDSVCNEVEDLHVATFCDTQIDFIN